MPGVGRQRIPGNGRVEAVVERRQLCLGQHLRVQGTATGGVMDFPSPEDTQVLPDFAPSFIVTMTMRDALMGPRASRLWA